MLWVVRGDGRRSWGILAGRFRRPIDPHGRGQRFWTWWPLYEPLRMGGVRRQARAVPDREDRRDHGVQEHDSAQQNWQVVALGCR